MMYTRLTPPGRSLRNGAFKVIGWTLAMGTVAAGAETATRIVRPVMAGWFQSRPLRPAPVMAAIVKPMTPPSYSQPAYIGTTPSFSSVPSPRLSFIPAPVHIPLPRPPEFIQPPVMHDWSPTVPPLPGKHLADPTQKSSHHGKDKSSTSSGHHKTKLPAHHSGGQSRKK